MSASINTAIVVIGATTIAVVSGVVLAWLVSRTDIPFARVLTIVPVMPLFFPPVVGAVAWVLLLAPEVGLINEFLRTVTGGAVGPVNIYNVWGVTWVVGIYITPYVYLMIANAFQQYDGAYEEAARTAGVPTLTVLTRITVPLLRPAIMAGAMLAFITALAQFSIPAIIGKTGNVDVYTTLIYDMLRSYPRQLDSAAVLSSLMVAVTMGVLWYQRRLLRRSSRFVTMSGKGLRRTRLSLGPWRWPLFVGIALYVLITVILPAFALLNVSLRRHWSSTLSLEGLTLDNFAWVTDGYNLATESMLNSGRLSVIGATVGMLLSVLIAYTVVRSRLRGRGALDYLAMFPSAIPATVLGAGLLMIYLGPPIALYGSNILLLIAYVAHHLPQGTRTATAAFHQVSPEMDEASYVCGASWLTTFRRIAIPLIGPIVAGGWLFLFVLMSRELSASVLVASPSTPVVSVVILDLWSNGSVPQLAAVSMIVLVLSAILTLVVQRVGNHGGAR
ncbi:iron ABC transporter permease [Saccharomonospora sp.]|uniref:ABC transporter permease n=1 Tax=Saccharomonospora sp. TaxID=33913 RepID=UPI0026057580|nr:iron ABC transporter permease [Saccharomonospora sp.]